jgi:hypothetical protein
LARLYVLALDTGEPVELRQYVAGLPPTSYRIEGPSLQLVVSFPRPRFTAVERESESDVARAWTARLQELPVQHAVLKVAQAGVGIMRVVDVPDPAVDARRRAVFLAASVAANGQAATEIAATLEWREAEVERLGEEPLPAGPRLERSSPKSMREPRGVLSSPRSRRPAARPGEDRSPAPAPAPTVLAAKPKQPAPAAASVPHEEEDDGSID